MGLAGVQDLVLSLSKDSKQAHILTKDILREKCYLWFFSSQYVWLPTICSGMQLDFVSGKGLQGSAVWAVAHLNGTRKSNIYFSGRCRS